MIKLKKLIKESAWDREFGESLPTLSSVTEKHKIEEKKPINEYGVLDKAGDAEEAFGMVAEILEDFRKKWIKVALREKPKFKSLIKKIDKGALQLMNNTDAMSNYIKTGHEW